MTIQLARLFGLLCVLLPCVPPARAQDAGQCGGARDVAMTERIDVARVQGRGRQHFVLAAEAGRAACPSAAASCRARAFLMPGDVVLTLPAPHKGHLCASYVNAGGVETSGWLPAAALAPVAPAPQAEAQWLGSWRRTEASIRIMRGKQGGLDAAGEATWGAGDRRRAAAGAVNTGEFAGRLRGSGDLALVADEDVASFESAKDGCAVRLRRVGPYLLVEDNMLCGGMNVSFSGLYVRR